MTFPFWPFRKPKTKLEILQDAASDLFSGAASGVQHKIEALPLDRVADSLKHTRENVLETLGHATTGAATALSSTASSASSQTKNLASNLAESAAVKGAAAKIADAKEFWHDRTDDWKDSAQNASHDARKTAHQRASDLADKTRATAKNTRAQMQEKLDAAPHAAAQSLKTAQQQAETVQQQAQEKAKATREHAAELTALAAAAFAEWKNQTSKKARRQAEIKYTEAHEVAQDAAQQAQQNAQNIGDAARHFTAKSSTRFEGTTEKARNAKAQIDEKAAQFENDAVRFAPQVHVEDATSKWLWIAVGALVGAALMLFLAPNNGRRSRALAQDKLRKAAHRAAKLRAEASGKAADLRNKAEGKLHEAQSADSEDFADDITIADRVRTALGEAEATRNMERINVDCADGVVTLRGPMIDEELKAQIEILVRAVKGVREVRSQFLIDDSANDNPGDEVFVG